MQDLVAQRMCYLRPKYRKKIKEGEREFNISPRSDLNGDKLHVSIEEKEDGYLVTISDGEGWEREKECFNAHKAADFIAGYVA